jgi:hypothetical protein
MMGADEKFVREHWEWFKLRFSEPHEGYAQGVYVVEIPMRKFSDEDESVALSLAAEYTRSRLEEIRQVEEEIATQSEFCQHGDECGLCAVVARTVARLQAALAELKRGMK